MKKVMNTIDTTLSNLRPRFSGSLPDQNPHWSNTVSSTVPQTPHGSEKWNPRMWRLIDNEMSLRHCSIYCYSPDEDPYDGEEGALWTFNYFFFNKEMKRVCYLNLRGLSIIGNSPPPKTPIKTKRPASGTWSIDEETSKKRARYWLGDRAGEAEWVANDEEDDVSGEWDEENIEETEVLDQGDEPASKFALFDTDVRCGSGSESPCKGRGRRSSSARGVSEEIVGAMDP